MSFTPSASTLPANATHANLIKDEPESGFWKGFNTPLYLNLISNAPPTSISTNPATSTLCITGGPRLTFFTPTATSYTSKLVSSPSPVWCHSHRSDGKLISFGGENGLFRVITSNNNTYTTLRTFDSKNIKGSIRSTSFLPSGSTVLSTADDGYLRVYDVKEGIEINEIKASNDSIRSLTTGIFKSNNIVATGGYDGLIKFWDVESCDNLGEIECGEGINCMVLLKDGETLISGSGATLNVYALKKTGDGGIEGRLLHSSKNHTKSITSLTYSITLNRLTSTCASGHIKFLNLDDYTIVHGMKYPSPITCMTVNEDRIIVGMSGGGISVKIRGKKGVNAEGGKKRKALSGTYSHFTRGKNEVIGKDDYRVTLESKKKLSKWDKDIKGFKYNSALKTALESRNPKVVVEVLNTLEVRRGLEQSLLGLESNEVDDIINFLCRYLPAPEYTKTLVKVCGVVVEKYGERAASEATNIKNHYKLIRRFARRSFAAPRYVRRRRG
ncbi:hypothetical protein TrLO_g3907 [Triparma laevis f. longispina]|uniref:U3 small nucleolar RNA-associated protein 15 C-terminal domain-containing protein n=1 Tax=Triparma laevis f. longispina TaxID=1714387 RepID=A0A9W7FSJ7_9STRA|nr:hypothetical protein TrLO_g3907 [Triparma laevis f. longispina]